MKNLLSYDPFELVHSILTNEPINKNWVSRRGIQHEMLDSEGRRWWQPSCDLKENATSYILYADIPGVDVSDIELSLAEDGMLTLRGERQLEKEEGDDFLFAERVSGSFRYQLPLFKLPNVDREQIQASGSKGVLKLIIKKKAKAEPRKIAINSED
jgi:HSP20 family protein